jgi:hypothetical protein
MRGGCRIRVLASEGVSRESKEGGGGGLSLQTLLISSLAAVAAAIVVPMFWERGSIVATAITPIIVAVVSEALNRPAAVIKTAAPRVARRTATGAAVRTRTPTGVGARGEGPEKLPPRRHDPFGLYEDERPRGNRRPLKIALITGLLAFIIGAGVVTASELAVFGHSVGQSGRSTGLWGGHVSKTPTPTPTASPSETPTATKTSTPTPTATPTISATPTPTPTIGTQQATPTATPPAAAPTATP